MEVLLLAQVGFKARRNAPYSYDYNYFYTPDKQLPATPVADASPNGAASADEPAPTAKA